MKKSAFTMIELVFVIVVLGILASIAVPRLLVTRDDAIYSKARSQISAIQSGIEAIKARNILLGQGGYPDTLDDINSSSSPTYNENDQELFYSRNDAKNSILQSPIFSQANSNGHWVKSAQNSYILYIDNVERGTSSVTFTYTQSNGRFTCDYDLDECRDIVR